MASAGKTLHYYYYYYYYYYYHHHHHHHRHRHHQVATSKLSAQTSIPFADHARTVARIERAVKIQHERISATTIKSAHAQSHGFVTHSRCREFLTTLLNTLGSKTQVSDLFLRNSKR